MKIEQDIKLDFSDVLIKPNYSPLSSRKEVNLVRKFTFLNAQRSWTGVPIMASNMDGVGTQDMALTLSKHLMLTCLTKDITNLDPRLHLDYFAVSTGIGESDLGRLNQISDSTIKFINIDVANGYSSKFVETVTRVRKEYPNHVIIAGNVVTADMTRSLILAGADIVKVGIGPGCFLPGTIVNTKDGPKAIEDVKVGDVVKTHTGAEKPVIDTLVYDNTKPIISINGIKSTDSHEYYVLHKKYKNIVTEENVHDLAEWVEAKDLTKDYLLLKHK